MDLVTKAMHYKSKDTINLKPNPTILDAGDCESSLDHGYWFVHQKADHFHCNILPTEVLTGQNF